MKTTSTLIALALSGAAWSGAQAQTIDAAATSYYAEIALVPLQIKEGGKAYDPTGMRIIVGKNINRNLAIEGAYIITVSPDDQVTFDAKADQYSLSVKPKLVISETIDAFARVGYGSSNVTSSSLGSKRVADWTYGLGIQAQFTRDVFGQVDYMSYTNKDGLWVRGVGVSLGMRF